MTATSSNEFCVSCHEMGTPLAEYQKTVHYQNPTGVRAGCSDCHVPETGWPYLQAKVRASKDLYHHLIGTLATPEDYEEHRLEMAQAVWDRMKANDSSECRSCHAFDAMTVDAQKQEAQKRHTEAMETGGTCIDCHKGIAHSLPDMKKAFARAFEELKETAADADLEDTAYTLETMPFYLEQGGDQKAGQLLPATELKITEQSGDWLKATVSGWRQEGAESVIYGAPGQRILTAVMAKPTVEQAEVGEGKVLPETGQTWMPVSVDVWLPQESVTASIEPVWSYAESIYQGDCATCHTAHTPNHFLANQWIGQLKSMERFSQLSKEQNRLVLKFLQYHAKDMTQTAAAGH
ncbi:trimethylamine-N-oxide reductase c-type cytochrome TorC [Caenispirillum salinarum AK4]|uniref:Cytochrome c-type protein NapC n=2 Tax=Caenispirillum TaxID=414051 RepID=K9HEK0_9PROT|nr:trimethylamine-N-oxide reductase c-type cytochrome TorC [Caenispirillum salinarum AK4]